MGCRYLLAASVMRANLGVEPRGSTYGEALCLDIGGAVNGSK